MNFSPQHPKVPAWSQIRARIGSAWNDLFYSDRPENDEPASGVTLRKLFAVVWLIAAIAFTSRKDLTTVIAVGVPLALLGYAYLNGARYGCFGQGVFWSWLVVGWYFCYQFPYDMAPVPLPTSAHDVRYSGVWADIDFRFEASPGECLETAQQHISKYPHLHYQPGHEINLQLDLIPPSCFDVKTNNSWFDVVKIKRGWYYAGYTRMWVDVERGIFYYQLRD